MFTKILYINLDRRTDRKEHMEKELNKINFKGTIEKISAVDGKRIDPNNIKHLFTEHAINELSIENPPHFHPGSFMSIGAAGCALSHRKAFINVLNGNDDKVLILEDDIKFDENFMSKYEEYIKNIPDYDLLYLGYHFAVQPENVNDYYKKSKGIVYGLFGYVIDKKIAQLLIDMFPIDKQIDSEIVKVFSQIKVFNLNENKRLIFSEDSLINKLGTDIQSIPKVKEGFKNTSSNLNLIFILILILLILLFFNYYK